MMTVSLSEAKDQLSALVDVAAREHETVKITKHGHTAAVLVSPDEWDAIHETLYWLSQSGIHDDITEARNSAEHGFGISATELRARYGLKPL